jgi:hypothetical protein
MTNKATSLFHVILQAALFQGGSFLGFICEIYHDKSRRTSLIVASNKLYHVRARNESFQSHSHTLRPHLSYGFSSDIK